MSNSSGVASFIFMNGEGELRSGWRILVFLILSQICSLLIGGILLGAVAIIAGGDNASRIFIEPGPNDAPTAQGLTAVILNWAVRLASVLAASAVCARLLELRSFGSIGYKLHAGWLKDFALGFLLGALTLALAVAIGSMAGAVSFQARDTNSQAILINAIILLVIFLIAASAEEAIVRGFIFQALLHNFRAMPGYLGVIVPIVITSAAFGVMHLFNPNATLFAVANTTLAGVWLGVAYFKTRSLWLATALHAAWNFVMVFVFGLPVSGITLYNEMALISGQCGPPIWISGGDYGPEGGAAATLALIICTIVIIKTRVFRASEEMLIATRHGSLNPRADITHADASET
jgi:membrane protease YdiL (CAAX protease family)